MRTFRAAAVAAAVLALSLVQANPAGAASGSTYTISPAAGPAGSTFTVSSLSPCPAPPSGMTFAGVLVVVINRTGTELVATGFAEPTADRSWTVPVDVDSSTRNGGYVVGAICGADDAQGRGASYFVYTPIEQLTITSPPGKADPAIRFAGTDRIATAISAEQDVFEDGVQAKSVVLSRADSYADALAGAPLGTAVGGPLLLTGGDVLDLRTEAEIRRVLQPNGTIYVLGGTAAISEAVTTNLGLSGYTVKRIAGANRYATAVKVADEIGKPTTLLLATGLDYKAGLVAGAAAGTADEGDGGGAVLLTNGTVMPPETRDYLAAHGAAKRWAIGTDAAAADPGASAVTGTDDADLSQKVAAQFFPQTAAVGIASMGNFADALSGGAHAADYAVPLLLTAPGALPPSVQAYLTGAKSAISIAYVYGGSAAVSEAVRAAVVAAIS